MFTPGSYRLLDLLFIPGDGGSVIVGNVNKLLITRRHIFEEIKRFDDSKE
jgi:hypothetical protein